ncbi:putative uncharacterized protein DDB_G0277255 [Battus philenor]|uniref:putative uncharacterized protein DDB_G0277255 n=1 Tax=Battus philenor TaxID=42288 RepID=UPI0035D138C5
MSPTIFWLLFCLSVPCVRGELDLSESSLNSHGSNVESDLENALSELKNLHSLSGHSSGLSGSGSGLHLGKASSNDDSLSSSLNSLKQLSRLNSQTSSDGSDSNNLRNLKSKLHSENGVYDFTSHLYDLDRNSLLGDASVSDAVEALRNLGQGNDLNIASRSGYHPHGSGSSLSSPLSGNRIGMSGNGVSGLTGLNVLARSGMHHPAGLRGLGNVQSRRSKGLAGSSGNAASSLNSQADANDVDDQVLSSLSKLSGASRNKLAKLMSRNEGSDLNDLLAALEANGVSGASSGLSGVSKSQLYHALVSNSNGRLAKGVSGSEGHGSSRRSHSGHHVEVDESGVNGVDRLNLHDVDSLNEFLKSELMLNEQTGLENSQLQGVSLNRLKEVHRSGLLKPGHLDKLEVLGRSGSADDDNLLSAVHSHNDGELNSLSALALASSLDNHQSLKSSLSNLNSLRGLSSSGSNLNDVGSSSGLNDLGSPSRSGNVGSSHSLHGSGNQKGVRDSSVLLLTKLGHGSNSKLHSSLNSNSRGNLGGLGLDSAESDSNGLSALENLSRAQGSSLNDASSYESQSNQQSKYNDNAESDNINSRRSAYLSYNRWNDFELGFGQNPNNYLPVPYQPIGVPYQPPGVPYQPTGVPYQPIGVPYKPTGVPYQPIGVPYHSASTDYQPPNSPLRLYPLRGRSGLSENDNSDVAVASSSGSLSHNDLNNLNVNANSRFVQLDDVDLDNLLSSFHKDEAGAHSSGKDELFARSSNKQTLSGLNRYNDNVAANGANDNDNEEDNANVNNLSSRSSRPSSTRLTSNLGSEADSYQQLNSSPDRLGSGSGLAKSLLLQEELKNKIFELSLEEANKLASNN